MRGAREDIKDYVRLKSVSFGHRHRPTAKKKVYNYGKY
jgi:hypothetical protein